MASRHQQRSHSPSGKFCSSSISSSSSFAASSSTFSSRSTSIFDRSLSPTRVNMYGSTSSSVRFSIENRATSPNRSFSVSRIPITASAAGSKKRTCLCSPTTHPGSFRCSYHKNLAAKQQSNNTVSYQPNRLNMRRSAMTNSLVRIGTVEGGEWVKRALAALIRPSSHQQRRRDDFRPRPSRLSSMSKAAEN